jgi:hypothetical protein
MDRAKTFDFLAAKTADFLARKHSIFWRKNIQFFGAKTADFLAGKTSSRYVYPLLATLTKNQTIYRLIFLGNVYLE